MIGEHNYKMEQSVKAKTNDPSPRGQKSGKNFRDPEVSRASRSSCAGSMELPALKQNSRLQGTPGLNTSGHKRSHSGVTGFHFQKLLFPQIPT